MKTTFLILFIALLSGCQVTRKGDPIFTPEDMPTCPDVINIAAKNLEQLGIDHAKVEEWKKSSLSIPQQPCQVCIKFNQAAYVLIDEKGVYKDAMRKFIHAVKKYDPNSGPPTRKETGEISNYMTDENDVKGYTLAQQYIRALEDVQTFLVAETHMPVDETSNFILDNYFIPLIKSDNEAQN